jgi:glyoxylate reductase
MKPTVYVTRHLPPEAYEELAAACEIVIWDEEYPPPYDVIRDNVAGKDGLICLLTDQIDARLMDAGAELKVISQIAVGYDNIDVAAASERDIRVGNTPGVLTDATADFAFTLLLAAARRIGEAHDYVRAGRWETWGLTLLLGQEVQGKTLGIVGMGRIGQTVAKRAAGFEMEILYHNRSRDLEAEREVGGRYCELDELLRASDFVSLHVNLTPQTEGLIDARALQRMKPTAILINTARGPVVDSEALYAALRDGEIGYAALDVTDPEPLPADHPLLTLSNCLVTPHIASATVASRTLMAQMAVRNCIAGVRGEPLPNPVN